MTAACKHIRPLVTGFLDDSLTPTRQRQVEAHLAQCSACRAHSESVKPLVKLLTSDEATAPRWSASREFKQRLEQAVRVEAVRRSRKARRVLRRFRSYSVIPAWLQHAGSMRLTLAGATMALAVVLAVVVSGPSRADTLQGAIEAIARCTTIHAVGFSGSISQEGANVTPGGLHKTDVAPGVLRTAEKLEFWSCKDGQAWLRMGDREYGRNGEAAWGRIPFRGKRQSLKNQDLALRPLRELANPEAYLRYLRRLQKSGSKLSSQTNGAEEIITIEGAVRRDIVAIRHSTKLISWTRTEIGPGSETIRSLDHFEYNVPVPPSVKKAISEGFSEEK